MSRSGYSDDNEDQWALIRWRGAVRSAIRGRRGQAFLREMIAALDALPKPELAAGTLRTPNGGVCALGAVAVARGIVPPVPDEEYDEGTGEERDHIGPAFGIADAMAREVMYMNDEICDRGGPWRRWERMRRWAISQLEGDL